MKFNITVEYDPDEDYEELDTMIKREIAQRVSNDIVHQMTNKYQAHIENVSDQIKNKIVNMLVDKFRDMLITEEFIKKIDTKLNTKLNQDIVKTFGDKILKEVKPKIKQMVKTEANASVKEINNNLSKIFKGI